MHGASRTLRSTVLLCALALSPTTAIATAVAQDSADAEVLAESMEAAQRALRGGRLPWYERETDELRPMAPGAPPSGAHHRDSNWVPKPSTPSNWQPRWRWRGWSRTLRGTGWVILTAITIALIVALVWAYRRSDVLLQRTRRRTGQSQESPDITAAFENLPFVLDADRPDLLAEARYRYEQRDFRRAVILLFSYQLIQLDQRQRIRLAKGKTNRQYLRELRGDAELQQIVQETMQLFEQTYFGGQSPTAGEFERCWRQLDAFHRELEPAAV